MTPFTALPADEQAAVAKAAQQAQKMAIELDIEFERAAREIARGSALYEESVQAILEYHRLHFGAERGTFGQQHHEQRLTEEAMDFAEALQAWFSRDREADVSTTYHLAGQLRLHAWHIASHAAALAQISMQTPDEAR